MISKLNCCTNTCAHCKELDQTLAYLVEQHQKYLVALTDKYDLMEKVVLGLCENVEKQTRLLELQSELKKLENQK